MNGSTAGKRGGAHFRELCLAFILTGAVNSLLAPYLPVAADRWGLRETEAGLFFPAQFLGGLCGTLLVGRLALALGFDWVFRLSFLCMAGGCLLASGSSRSLALGGVGLWGLGLGFNIPSANVLAARSRSGTDIDVAVTFLNFWWGVGAILGPSLLSVIFARWGLQTGMLLIAAGGFLGAWAWRRSDRLDARTQIPLEAQPGESESYERRRAAALSSLLLLLYVGTEASLGGWLPTLAIQKYGLDSAGSGSSSGAFWASLVAGRALTGLAVGRMRPWPIVRSGCLVFLAGLGLLASSETPGALYSGAILAGLGLAPVFPLSFAAFCKMAARRHWGTVGWLFGSSATGGAVIPPGVGILIEKRGPEAAFLLLAITGSAAAALFRRLVGSSGPKVRA